MLDCENKTNTTDTEPVDRTCPAVGYQKIAVCVPVNVTPFAHSGPTSTKCCGNPVVVAGEKPCAGKKNGVCSFTITQTICVEVPVTFGAVSDVGDTYVDCISASANDICTGCDKVWEE